MGRTKRIAGGSVIVKTIGFSDVCERRSELGLVIDGFGTYNEHMPQPPLLQRLEILADARAGEEKRFADDLRAAAKRLAELAS